MLILRQLILTTPKKQGTTGIPPPIKQMRKAGLGKVMARGRTHPKGPEHPGSWRGGAQRLVAGKDLELLALSLDSFFFL